MKGVLFGNPLSLIKLPGAYTNIELPVDQPGVFDPNRVVLVGAAVGGEPFRPYRLTEAAFAAQIFGYSPLAEAIALAFQGGEKGGATAVTAIRVDDSQRATAQIPKTSNGSGISARVKDYGAYGNLFVLSFKPGSIQGTMADISGYFVDGRPFKQKFDNYPVFSELVDRINLESPIEILAVDGGTFASQVFTLTTNQVNGRATIRDAQFVNRSTQAFAFQFPVSTLQALDSLVVSFPETITWAIASKTDATNILTMGSSHTLVEGNLIRLEGNGSLDATKRYVVKSIATLNFKIAEYINVQQSVNVSSVDPTANSFTATGHPFAVGDGVTFSSGTGPATRDRIYFVSEITTDTFKVALTVGGATFDFSTNQALNLVANKVSGADVLVSTLNVTSATATLLFGKSNLSGSTPDEFNGDRNVTTVVPAFSLSVTNALSTSVTYGSDMARFTFATESWQYVQGRSLPGTQFTIASGQFAGTYVVMHFEWTGLGDDKSRIVRKLSGDRVIPSGNFSAALSFMPALRLPKAQSLNEAIYTYIPANGLLSTGGQYLTLKIGDNAVAYSTVAGDTIQSVTEELADLVNQESARLKVIASYTYNAVNYLGTLQITADTPGSRRDPVALYINPQPTLNVTSGGTVLGGGSDPPPPRLSNGTIGGSLTFSGGFDSAPTYNRWLAVTEVLKSVFGRWIVPISGDPGVHAIFSEHANTMSATVNRRERCTIVGHNLNRTKQDIKAQAMALRSRRTIFCSSGARMADSRSGSIVLKPAYLVAAAIAGMLAAEGNGVSDPITQTFIRGVFGLEHDYSRDRNGLEEMVDAGVLVLDADISTTRQSRGFWITTGITTSGDNITMINQADHAAARVRERQESFIGRARFSYTLSAIRTETNLELDILSTQGFIYGFDPKATVVSANQTNRNAIDVLYKIYFAPDIEFILNTQIVLPVPLELSLAS